MNLERALKLKGEAITRLRDYYSSALHFGPPAAEMDSKVAAIRAEVLSGAPRWAIAEFKGYAAALRDSLYYAPTGPGPLIYGGFVDGRFLSTYSGRPDYYESNGVEPGAWAAGGAVQGKGYYWSQFDPPRPYFVD